MTEESNFARDRAQECLQNDFNMRLEADDMITPSHRVLRIQNQQGENLINEEISFVTGFNIVRDNTILRIDIRLNPNYYILNRVIDSYITMGRVRDTISKNVIDENDLKKIKARRIKRNEKKRECSICLCKMMYRQLVRSLPCKHVFHTKCVDQWLLSTSNSCPICRYVI